MRAAFAEAQNRPRLLRLLEAFALADRPPTGFLRDIIVERNGEHRGTLDIKKGGLLPIVDLARSAGLCTPIQRAVCTDPSWLMNADCIGCSSLPFASPSMVVISSPSCITASVRHELIRRPFTSTVQAPHWP